MGRMSKEARSLSERGYRLVESFFAGESPDWKVFENAPDADVMEVFAAARRWYLKAGMDKPARWRWDDRKEMYSRAGSKYGKTLVKDADRG